MAENLVTHVAIILDKSGSMAATKDAAITGFNEQIQQLKQDEKMLKDQSPTNQVLCYLISFNGEVYEHLWGVEPQQMAEADSEDYKPNGSTAMRDAVGYTVQKLLDSTDHANPNHSYLIVTVSDGATNSDKHYQPAALKEVICACQETKRWTFTYVGCGEEYMKEISRTTGVPVANMAKWSNATEEGAKQGFQNVSRRQGKFFAERAAGQYSTENYASDEDNLVADYEEAPIQAAVAPKVTSLEGAKDLDAAVCDAGPKYVRQASMSYHGEALFKNSVQVKWENK